ncbi:MAG: GH3 auxin-responsive promoter family protein [Deltaproteobacteria bacterium]|nr:GH3 auxin-responsive promoter family protein [Deltaproteobacteria bacterium]MBK8238014.1 GH3 auxin-responsive promoter family protein [Deltaproteobacteria bacterium]MBK8718643.1 GH3 auxin-responsive promoter family protein [Deltaproteobacteria bacterium]MBP7291242.1 GH3 auxin-responsive promoter family protein [Nannocystaceae bacterium]
MTAPEYRSQQARVFVDALADSATTQQQLLQQLLADNRESEFGRAHEFAKIRSFAEYQRAVPVRKYEGFESQIDRVVAGEQGVLTTEPVKRFFLTSGSTAKSKYIPVTNTFVRAKSRAFGIYWAEVFARHPAAKAGRMVTNFSDSGEAVKAPGSGLPCSSESAYWAGVTRATSLTQTPIIPKSVAQIGDSDGRYYAIARILMEEDFSVIMTLNPSTIVLLFQKIAQFGAELVADVAAGGISERVRCGDEVRRTIAQRYTGNPARADALAALLAGEGLLAHRMWPALRLAICWRSPMLQPYLELLAPQLVDVAARDYILMASEGVMAIPIEDERSGGPLAVGVHVYEFIPEEQYGRADAEVLLPHQLEDGKTYVLVLTNGSGLYRYDIGDVVRVRGFVGTTPCIEFLHRAGATCSLTGEKLTEDQVTQAVRDVARALDLKLAGFTLAPARGGFPRYVAYVEFDGEVERRHLQAFPERLDDALEQHNIEYGGKRSSQRLAAPELAVVRAGGYDARRRQRLAGGTSDSQIKPTHLSRDPDFGDQFDIVERFHGNP